MVYPKQPHEVGRITLVMVGQPDLTLALQIDVDFPSADPGGDTVMWLRKAADIIDGKDAVKATVLEVD
jgi:hypothetical protein